MDDDGAVAQFADITGAAPDRARQYLTLADGSVERAVQLFFESGGVDMGGAFAGGAGTSTSAAAGSTSSQRAGAGPGDAIPIDSDDDDDDNIARENPHNVEDDEAIARRMQEEMYGGVGGGTLASGDADIDPATGVRRPVARTAEVLAAPSGYGYGGGGGGLAGEDDEEELNEAVRQQLLARQRRNVQRPGIFNQRPPASESVWENEDEAESAAEWRLRLSRATGGASDATSKSTRLAELYRPPFDIISPLVSWDGIRAQGKETEKWILLNVQDPNIFDCQILNRDIWRNAEIKETVRENFIFKQYTKSDPQAQNYIRYYFPNVDSQDAYPHIAIVDPRTGEQVKVWSGPPVAPAVEFLSQLHEFLDRYSLKAHARNPVATRKHEPKRVDVERMTEDEMLEMALQNSLAAAGSGGDGSHSGPKPDDPDDLTRQRADLDAAVTPPRDASPALAGNGGQEQDEEKEEEASPFAQISSTNPHEEPAAGEPDTTRIQFRHPGGRVIRRFGLGEQVRRIYEWLKAAPLDADVEEGGVASPPRAFELVFMGRNLIEGLDETIAAAGLKNGSVMVEFVDAP